MRRKRCWLLGIVGGVMLLVGGEGAAAIDKACVKSCTSEKNTCTAFFKEAFKADKAECAVLARSERKQCIKAAKQERNAKRALCKGAYKSDCKPCCAGADTSQCSVRVCGDGQQVLGEECEPPSTEVCDDLCRLITTTTTTTSTTTTSSTTTTVPVVGIGVTVSISPPPNGMYFVAGDAPVVTVVLNDDDGNPLMLDDLARANLYLYGPQDEAFTTTAVGLLRASTDRNASTHHYINLKTNPEVLVGGNVLTYPLSEVSDELHGTYTATVWAALAADALQQWMPLADCQIGTPDPETQIVERDMCASCHRGASNGKYYLHHIDPGFSPAGNWALDSWPVRTCKACHNQEGYAAYNNGAGGTDSNVNRTPDPIVRRVHGVHRGEGLELPFNIDPVSGDFRDYIHVVFPKDVRNCTACHVDDRWQSNPSRQACGACHDSVWFGDPAATPSGYENHPGGEQDTDLVCTGCHGDGALYDVAVEHAIEPPPLNQVGLSLTPPTNGTYYEAGEAPVVTIVIRDDGGLPIDHRLVTSGNFATAGLFVSGPRSHTLPVLTNTARYGSGKLRASVSSAIAATGAPAGWTFAAGDTFRIAVNGGAPGDLLAPSGLQTPAQVRDWLAAALTGVTVTSSSTSVTIRSNLQGASSHIDIYDSPVTTIMGWKAAGVTAEPDINVGRSSYPINDLRELADPLDYTDPAVTRFVDRIEYQLDDVAGLSPGTYSAYVWSRPSAGKIGGLSQIGYAFVNFQVGTDVEESKIATNCTNCHGDTIMHKPSPTERGPHPAVFDPDQCKSCHDYSHYETGDAFKNQGGTSTNGWSGFGAVPLARRVHGVHFGRYLDHPEQIYAGGNPFSEVIFPQDVRNCVTCHSETDTWTTKPSRVPCLGCHDSDATQTHARLQTYVPDPDDPYGPTAVESCPVCHGENALWSAAVVHNIWAPYAPPYPRNPE